MDERSVEDISRNLESRFGEAGEKAGEAISRGVGRAFGGLEKDSQASLDKLVKQADIAGAAIGAALIGGITGATLGLAKIGDEFENINRGIMLSTNATGAALDGMKSQAMSLVGELDTSASAVGSTLGTLSTRLNLTGEDLRQMSYHVTELGDRWGKLNEGLLSSDFVKFNVNAAQTVNTLASLNESARATGVNLNEIVGGLGGYGDTLKESGLNIEQAGRYIANITATQGPEGVAKGIVGMETAMTQARKRNEDFPDFLKQVAMSIQQFGENSKEADQISEAVFGGRRWAQAKPDVLEYLNVINQGPAAFHANAASMTDFEKSTQNLGNVWHQFRNEMEAALGPQALGFVEDLKGRLEEFGEWCKAHQQDLANLFKDAATVAGAVVTVLEKIAELLGSHPGLIEGVAVAFVAWESLKGVATLITNLGVIADLFGGVDAAVATTAAATTAAGAEMGLAFGPVMTELPVIATEAEAAGVAITTSMTAADGAVVGLNATLDGLVAGLATVASSAAAVAAIFAGLEALNITFGSATGQESNVTPGVQYGPDGSVLSAGPKAPGHGSFYDQWYPKTGPYAGAGPGANVPGSGRVFGPPNPNAPAPTPGAPAAPDGPIPGGLLTPGDFDPVKKGPRLPPAPEVPYGPGFGDAPRPGETAKQYDQEQKMLEERHKVEEAAARLHQLEQTNTATADDIQKAKNKLLEAESSFYKAEEAQTKSATEGLEQMGAKIDKDFGISKGLPGIAENLTKFLANLAFAPVFGALGGANAAIGGPTFGGKGAIGAAALAGAFGPQFTPEALEAEGASPNGRGRGGGGSGLGSVLGPGGPVMGAATGTGSGQGGPGGFLGDISAAGGSGIPSPAPGGGAESWRNTVAAVVDKYGPAVGVTPGNRQAWIDNIVRQIGTESGGNAGADNPNDSNGQGGRQHVAGLLQYLPSSYAGSGGKLTGLPYMDPVGQIAGALFAPRNADGSPNTGAPGGIGAGHGWGPTSAPINPSLIRQGAPAPGVPGFDPAQAQGGWHPHDGPAAPALPGFGPQAGRPGAPVPGPGNITDMMLPPSYAEGGATPPPSLPGGGIPIIAHQNEHVLTSDDVNAMGGQSAVYAMRENLHAQDGQPGGGPDVPKPGGPQAPSVPNMPPIGGPKPGPSMIGGIAPGAGYGSGFQVTGGGLIGVAESLPATAASMAASFGLYGGAIEDLPRFDNGGEPGGAGAPAGGGSPGGAGGGGSPGGSAEGAIIGIAFQELNEAISKGGQAAGAVVGGLQQTFGPQQFAQSKQAQTGWVSKLVGGITGAQPQLPNTAGPKGGTPGLTPEQAASQQGGAPGGGGGGDTHIYNAPVNNGVQNGDIHTSQNGEQFANDLGRQAMAGYPLNTGSGR